MKKYNNNTIFDHYIAIDWAEKNMAIARMTKKSNKITAIDVPSDLEELILYLKRLKGTKVLAMEETTVAQWLYTELKPFVNRLIVSDPNRNKLLGEGPKNDKIDARKLVHLLRSNLLKEVYHSGSDYLNLRRLVSGYEDLIRATVRLKNQRASLLKACGVRETEEIILKTEIDKQVLSSIDRQLVLHDAEKIIYIKTFRELSKKYIAIRHQMDLPGINLISAVKIISRVVSPFRFATNGQFLSYAGLIKLERISGGRSYGKKKPRYSRQLKNAYKTAVAAAIGGKNEINDYYEYLINKKRRTEFNARNAACRRIAILSLGVFRSGKKYKKITRGSLCKCINN